jgi:hypothetical protein
MSEVKVTRADRQRAAEAVFGVWFQDSDESVWIETAVHREFSRELIRAEAVAMQIAFAAAEARAAGYAACLADVVAWHRDRDRQRSAEDAFFEGYESARKGMGLAEAVYRGTQAVAKAIEAGECVGAADELANRDADAGAAGRQLFEGF